MRSFRKNDALESDASTYHAGVETAALRSSMVVSTMGQQQSEDSTGPIDAAIGIKNGLLLGGAFWIVALSIFGLVNYFA